MKWTLVIAMLGCVLSAFAQPRDLTPTKKRQAFGKRDFRDLRSMGLQVQVGATTFLTRSNNEQIDVTTPTDGFRGNYTHDPYGKLGAYAEIGLFHFPKNRSKLSLALKTVLVSYYDWGIGFKYFRGGEEINANFIDAGGVTTGSDSQSFSFSNGNIYGRFSLHKNIHFKKNRNEKTNFFLDNSLGINVDYRLLTNSKTYDNAYSVMMADQQYYKPLHVQMHYGLGFGFRLKRGSYLIPGVRIPILGYQSTVASAGDSGKGSTAFGKPSMHWFSSRYWPMLIHVKYMFAFEKKSKGCATGITNDQDRDTQRKR